MRWTNEQLLAIESRGESLVVSAAAGSGKTAVLVERICGLVAEGVDIARMLVATFTRAAAAEMRGRIAARLGEMAEGDGGDVKRLQEQVLRIDRASIGTMHSFCGELLREHYNIAGIEPTFKTEEESVTRGLFDEALEETIDAFFEAGDAGFIKLADCWGGRDGRGLVELVKKVYGVARNHPEPLQWLKNAASMFSFEDPMRTPWYGELLEDLHESLGLALECLGEALRVAQRPDGPASYAGCIEEEMNSLAGLAEAATRGNTEGLRNAAGTLFGRLPQLRNAGEGAKALGLIARGQRDEAKRLYRKALENPIVAGLGEIAARTRAMGPQMEALHALVLAFDAKYTEEKRYANVLDFSDLEHLSLAVLGDEGARDGLRNYYEYVFVDEYQDINPVQDAILGAVARPGRFFCVGDVKQSIYRFRSAEPEIFVRRLANASAGGEAPERRVDLNSNFRSSPGAVDLVNYLFAHLMSERLGGVAYGGSERLACAAPRPPAENSGSTNANELILIDNGGRPVEEMTRLQELMALEREAAVAAGKINELVGSEFWDGKAGKYRKLAYSDIAVLLRTVTGVAADYAEGFRRAGIPVYAEAEGGFADEIEVQLMMNLLRLVDNAYRDFELITSLYSPIGGFSLEDLVEIRGLHKEGSFAEAVYRYASEDNGELAERIHSFLSRLSAWRALARHSDIEKLIFRICDDTGFMDWAGALPGGEYRQANILRLAELARGYAGGLFGFVRDFEHLAAAGAGGKRIGRPAGAVTIMSVHKAKGLEFPVVILANVGRGINLQDAGEHMLTHGGLGLGPRWFDAAKRTKADTLARAALLRRTVRDALSEEMRMLYVALTRARERIVVVGTVSDLRGRLKRWALAPTASGLAHRAKCWADWLGPMALRTPRGREAFAQYEPDAGMLPDAPVAWAVTLIDAAGIESPRSAHTDGRQALETLMEAARNAEIPEKTAKALGWRYPWGDVSALPSKVSATSLLDRGRDWRGPVPAPEARRLPRFMEEAKAYSAADIGTFAHTALQLLPIDITIGEIGKEIIRLEESGLLPEGAAAAIDAGWIERFHRSDIAARMRRSAQVQRELPFNLSAPVSAILPGETGGDEILVQGIIDCCFTEDGKWVLLDYKTNRVDAIQTAEKIAEHYRPQILTYKTALETITGMEVKEAYLYLLAVGEEIAIDIRQ